MEDTLELGLEVPKSPKNVTCGLGISVPRHVIGSLVLGYILFGRGVYNFHFLSAGFVS